MRARLEADKWVFSLTGLRGSEVRDMGIDECVADVGKFFQTES